MAIKRENITNKCLNCGGDGTIKERPELAKLIPYRVECWCGVCGPFCKTGEDAIMKWNRSSNDN